MTLTEKIDAIIQRRKPLASRIEDAQGRLQEAAAAINKLRAFRDSLDPVSEPELAARLNNLSTTDFDKK